MHFNYRAVLRIEISRVTCEVIGPFIATAEGETRRRRDTPKEPVAIDDLNGATGGNEERRQRKAAK